MREVGRPCGSQQGSAELPAPPAPAMGRDVPAGRGQGAAPCPRRGNCIATDLFGKVGRTPCCLSNSAVLLSWFPAVVLRCSLLWGEAREGEEQWHFLVLNLVFNK